MSTDQTSALPRAEQPRVDGEMEFQRIHSAHKSLFGGSRSRCERHIVEAHSDAQALAFMEELVALFDRHQMIAETYYDEMSDGVNLAVVSASKRVREMAVYRQVLDAVRLEAKLAERI